MNLNKKLSKAEDKHITYESDNDEELEEKYNKCKFERSQYLEKYNLCKLENNTCHNDDDYEETKNKDLHQGRYIYGIFHMIMVIIAMYLSFKCNNKEYHVGSMLIAFFFPYVYIIYILATQGTCGILEK